jgi:hypothetical protein
MPPEPRFFSPSDQTANGRARSHPAPPPSSSIGAHRRGKPRSSAASTRPRHLKLLRQEAAEHHCFPPLHGEHPLRAPLSSNHGNLIVPLPPLQLSSPIGTPTVHRRCLLRRTATRQAAITVPAPRCFHGGSLLSPHHPTARFCPAGAHRADRAASRPPTNRR